MRIHVGSGPQILPGWVNVDLHPYPGVEHVLDVRGGLPFADVARIFAEHFLEHLTLAEGLAFLTECRRVLRPDGILRLSTPNLDWVWSTHYRPPDEMPPEMARTACLELNRAFHGWGHRFLYNRETLASALRAAGFAVIEDCAYGESRHPDLRGLERHDRSAAPAAQPPLLLVEASGEAAADPDLPQRAAVYLGDFAAG